LLGNTENEGFSTVLESGVCSSSKNHEIGNKYRKIHGGHGYLLADPALPRKLGEGMAETVRPCIYCYSCISQAYFRRPVICTVNPEMGFERDLAIQPAAAPKRAVVIGGGPNGMESARRLALAGHVVTILQRSDRLGGDLNVAAETYEPNEQFLDWLKREVGSAPRIAIIGGSIAGLEIAEWLTGNGRSVTVIDSAAKLGAGLPIVRRARVLFELKQKGVASSPISADMKINAGEVSWKDGDDSMHRESFDNVLITAAKMGGLSLAQQLGASGLPVFSVGDCNGPGYLEKMLRDVAELVHAL
jgi:hypothetical protein